VRCYEHAWIVWCNGRQLRGRSPAHASEGDGLFSDSRGVEGPGLQVVHTLAPHEAAVKLGYGCCVGGYTAKLFDQRASETR
jgi:hypothetical protein